MAELHTTLPQKRARQQPSKELNEDIATPENKKQKHRISRNKPEFKDRISALRMTLATCDKQTLDATAAAGEIMEKLQTKLEKCTNLRLLDSTGSCAEEVTAALEKLGSVDGTVMLGVVGDTGTGKSSLINALLDYEQIAPASGLGACTAVPTEFLYKEPSEAGQELDSFTAEVQYVTEKELLAEAEMLLHDIEVSFGITKDSEEHIEDDESDDGQAGQVAWEKIRVIFPSLAKEDLLLSREDNTFDRERASDVLNGLIKGLTQLGTTEMVCAATESEFAQKISGYVASQVTSSAQFDGVPESESGASGLLWPLIKRFRVFLDAEILRTGVILVDLPGQRDANPARNRVADSYKQSCDALILAMEMKRAVDNKSGDQILKDRLQRLMTLDGHNIAVVCTKSDDQEASVMATENPKALSNPVHETVSSELGRLRKEKIRIQKEFQRVEKEYEKAKSKSAVDATLTERRDSIMASRIKIEEEIRRLTTTREWHAIKTRNDYVKVQLAAKIQAHIDSMGLFQEEYENEDLSVPIFAVSAREYQFLNGNFDSEGSKKFLDEDGTEIPALREHCKNIAHQGHVRSAEWLQRTAIDPCLLALLKLEKLDFRDMTEGARKDLERVLKKKVGHLKDQLEAEATGVVRRIDSYMQKVSVAAEQSEGRCYQVGQKTIDSWFWSSSRRQSKGYAYHTFMALMVRKGLYKDIDLNFKLLEPMFEAITKPWTKYVQKCASKALAEWGEQCKKLVWGFHSNFCESVQRSGKLNCQFRDMDNPARTVAEGLMESRIAGIQDNFKIKSREIIGAFSSLAKQELDLTYQKCREEHGPGAYKRILKRFSQAATWKMFTRCQIQLSKRLANLVEHTSNDIYACTRDTCKQVEAQYDLLLGTRRVLTREEIVGGKIEVRACLDYALSSFEKAIKVEEESVST